MNDHPNALLDRSNAGLRVQLAYLPLTGIVGVQCSVEDRCQWVTVDPAKALDAFHHPMIYLAPAQVADLFPRTCTVEDEEEPVEAEAEDIPV